MIVQIDLNTSQLASLERAIERQLSYVNVSTFEHVITFNKGDNKFKTIGSWEDNKNRKRSLKIYWTGIVLVNSIEDIEIEEK